MTLEESLAYLGFPDGRNPFASVNARDERGVLEGYFVTLCRAANVPLADDNYLGQPLAIWLRVLQYLEEHDRSALRELLELLDDTLPEDSRAKKETLPDLYYSLSG